MIWIAVGQFLIGSGMVAYAMDGDRWKDMKFQLMATAGMLLAATSPITIVVGM